MQVAHAIAETVLGQLQRREDGQRPLAVPAGEATRPLQTETPIGFSQTDETFAGIQFRDGEGLAVATESGQIIRLRPGAGRNAMRALPSPSMDDETMPRRRRPMQINLRPGEGGLKRIQRHELDLKDGLGEFGEINWSAAPGGALIGVMELDPDGNTVLLERISNDDRDERFVDQHRPCLSLVAQYPDTLRPRIAIFAENMSGVREVRPDRAGPPNDGTLERDDILLLDEYIGAGWVEHVIWRDPTRIARDVPPGATIAARLQKNRVGIWIANWGRRVGADDLHRLYQEMLYSAHERDQLVQKLYVARMMKGPFAGNGHLGATPLGVVREKRTRDRYEDEEQMQWINLAFELAESGLFDDGCGFSVRRLAAEMRRLGFPLSPERLRSILTNPMYATGENVAVVGGIPIEQRPIPFKNPVPIDRYLRVQELLALRQGKSSLTPIGEFLFNYVDALHVQCQHERNYRELPARIKGHLKRERNGEIETLRQYRHAYFTPAQCKRAGRGRLRAFVWERDVLEGAVVTEIRRLVSHPELLRQLAAAARHTPSNGNGRLTDAQRSQLERELDQRQMEKKAAANQWVGGFGYDQKTQPHERTFANFQIFISSYDDKISEIERRLARDADARATEDVRRDPRKTERTDAFLEIMSLDTPADPLMRQLRARLFQRIVSRILIDDDGHPDSPITITIEGHLVPEDATLGQMNPIAASADLLDGFNARKRGKTPAAEALLDEVEQIRTDLSSRADRSVSNLVALLPQLPSPRALERAQADRLEGTTWLMRQAHGKRTGRAGWRTSVMIESVDRPTSFKMGRKFKTDL